MGFNTRYVQAPASWGDALKDLTRLPSHGTLRVDRLLSGGNYVADVLNLVYQIKLECAEKNDIIDELRISGHGSNAHFRIGSDAIMLETLPTFADELKKIAPLLNPRGVVILEHCHAGENIRLMGEFSKLLGGIVVTGREGTQDSITGPEGTEWKVQDPDGRANPNVA